jgi:DNA-binding beta-propeller fold protein YncE
MQRFMFCLSALLGVAVFAAVPAIADSSGYKLIKTIHLPGDKGGHGDWTTFDPATDTVWLSQSPDHNVVVLDAQTMSIKHVIPGIKDGNGIALTPNYAFLSDNGSDVTVVVDKNTFEKVATLHPQGKGPNGTVFDPKIDTVLVTTDSDDATVFSAQKPFTVVGHFRLQPDPAKDGPDVGLYVPSLDRVYQPVDNVVDVVDLNTRTVTQVLKPGIEGSAKPIVYDSKTDRFILGTTDMKMLVLDGKTGNVVSSIPVSGKVDETVIDEAARRAYVGDKAGKVEVIDLDQDKVVDTLPSEPNVHTLAVDTKTHRIFVYRNVSNKVDVFEPTSGQ